MPKCQRLARTPRSDAPRCNTSDVSDRQMTARTAGDGPPTDSPLAPRLARKPTGGRWRHVGHDESGIKANGAHDRRQATEPQPAE